MNTSIRDLIDSQARINATDTFLIDPVNGDVTTYAQAQKIIASIALYINSRGVRPQTSVAYAMHNGPDTALCVLGIIYGGFRATAINLVAGNDTIAYVLEHSECSLVFTNRESEDLVKQARANLSGIEIEILDIDALPEADPSHIAQHSLTAESDGLLMYTSGTTGRPKGVVLSHRSLLAGGHNTALGHELTDADRALCVLPLYHINGLCVTLFGPLVSGGSVILPVRFSTGKFWAWAAANDCTWFSIVPTQLSYLLHASDDAVPLPAGHKIRFGRSASAPLSPEVHQAFEQKFDIPIVETMGLTETAAQILSNPMPPGLRKIGSPGVAVGDEVMIADKQQHSVAAGVEGELLVKGDNVMSRYLKNPDATKEAITSGGWFRTGDLGKMDADGYVFITGRLKELIIKGGENIAPREIDEALYRHPDVIEAAAFALNCKQYGQRVEAAVMLAEQSSTDAVALLKLCESIVGKFKTPDCIHVMPELPKGPSGKIQRIRLAELFESKLTNDAP